MQQEAFFGGRPMRTAMGQDAASSGTMRPRTLAELRAVCLKKREAWDSRVFYRRISIPITWLLVRTPVRPNHVTSAAAVMAALGITVFAWPQFLPLWRFFGLLGVQLAIVLDHVDGELARATGRTSPGGSFLDTFTLEVFAHLLMAGGLAAAVYLGTRADAWLAIGAAFVLLKALSIATFYVRGYLGATRETRAAHPSKFGAGIPLFHWVGSLFWTVRNLTNTVTLVFLVEWILDLQNVGLPSIQEVPLTPLGAYMVIGVAFLGVGLAGSVWNSAHGRLHVDLEPYK